MFVEITRGRSFRGLAQYCLHDVDRQGDSRVAFVETRNLGTDDPQLAWRIMAARHYLQDELKAKAGVGRGGAKDGKPVGHLLLSWKHEEAEAEQLTQLGMVNAAHGALRALGAQEHQAIIIGHTDTAHPHCHVIINLIGEDGRLKKNWNERKKLSKFALKREVEVHGEPVVKKRQKNWLDRHAGETPEPVKKKPRHLYELDKAAKKCPDTRRFAAEHQIQVQELERAKARQLARHKRHQARLKWCLEERNRRTRLLTDQKLRRSRSEVRKSYQQVWQQLLLRQEATRREFREKEASLKGSLSNALQLVNWKRVLRRKRNPDQPGLREAFQILTSEAARREKLQQRQQAEQDQLRSRQRQAEHAQERELSQEQSKTLTGQRQAYLRKAAGMKRRQARSHQRLTERQQALTKERNVALRKFRELEQQRKQERARQRLQVELVEHEFPPQQPRQQPAVDVPHADAKSLTQSAMKAALPEQQLVKVEPAREDQDTTQKPERTRRERQPRPPRSPRERKPATLAQAALQSTPPIEERPVHVATPQSAGDRIAPAHENQLPELTASEEFEKRMHDRWANRTKMRDHDRGR